MLRLSRSTPDSLVGKQHFLLDNIRLKLKLNRIQLGIPMKGVAFPSGLFRVLYKTINRRTWHNKTVRGWNLGGKRSGDITPHGRFKCSLRVTSLYYSMSVSGGNLLSEISGLSFDSTCPLSRFSA